MGIKFQLPNKELQFLLHGKRRRTLCLWLFSSPEHEVLMVSYCDQSMSVVRRQQFVLNANSS